MSDRCRVCGVLLTGCQCRWIFSSSTQLRLQAILSHVLGFEVTRDGGGEFLCGKCVFRLEEVVKWDADIIQLQNEHICWIQKLRAEKEHLTQSIVYIYNKNNLKLNRTNKERVCSKTQQRSHMVVRPKELHSVQLVKSWCGPLKNYMRRCVSSDSIVRRPTFGGTSRHESAAGHDDSSKNCGLNGSRQLSKSSYFDLVQHKRPGIGTSFVKSINQSISSKTPLEPNINVKGTQSKVFTARPRRTIQAKALLHSSEGQPSVISELIQLLRCISKRRVSVPAGSHIPVLKQLGADCIKSEVRCKPKEAEWKSLHGLAEQFDDEYPSVRVEVV